MTFVIVALKLDWRTCSCSEQPFEAIRFCVNNSSSKNSLVAELKELSFFRRIADDELSKLSEFLIKKSYNKGNYIVRAKDEDDSLMFVLSGKCRVALSTEDGREVILAHLKEGDFLGEIALLTGSERSADVIAAKDTTVLLLSRANFELHIKQHSSLAVALLRHLALRLRDASAKIADLALLDVYCRVARAISDLPYKSQGQLRVVENRPTHQELAAMVGTSREMVTRALKRLEEEEYISIDGKQILIHSMPI